MPAVVPTVAEVTLRNARTKVTRIFEQVELSIEGEARLVSMGPKVAQVLDESGRTWTELQDVFTNVISTDYKVVWDLLTVSATYAPDLVADLGTILLGIYPTDEAGAPNPDFEADRTFLRGALNIRQMVELFATFVAQNDYRRILAPFGLTLTETMAVLRGRPASVDESGTDEPSSGGLVVGLDGSPIELLPDEPTETPSTPSTTEVAASESATSSDPSPR